MPAGCRQRRFFEKIASTSGIVSSSRGLSLLTYTASASTATRIGVGGYPNNNVVGGVIPSINGVADTYSRDELIHKLRIGVRHPAMADPSGEEPLLYMPRWEAKLLREEIEDLADYLISLGGSSSGGGEW